MTLIRGENPKENVEKIEDWRDQEKRPEDRRVIRETDCPEVNLDRGPEIKQGVVITTMSSS